MPTNATIYIQAFDQTAESETLGRKIYRPDEPPTSTDVVIRVNVPEENLQSAFQYTSNGLNSNEESAKACYITRLDRTFTFINKFNVSMSVPIDTHNLSANNGNLTVTGIKGPYAPYTQAEIDAVDSSNYKIKDFIPIILGDNNRVGTNGVLGWDGTSGSIPQLYTANANAVVSSIFGQYNKAKLYSCDELITYERGAICPMFPYKPNDPGVDNTAYHDQNWSPVSVYNQLLDEYGYYLETSTPGAKLDFVQQLAKEVFGSINAVDLFSNEDDIGRAYEQAILSCGWKVNNFASSELKLLNDQITRYQDSPAGVPVKVLYRPATQGSPNTSNYVVKHTDYGSFIVEDPGHIMYNPNDDTDARNLGDTTTLWWEQVNHREETIDDKFYDVLKRPRFGYGAKFRITFGRLGETYNPIITAKYDEDTTSWANNSTRQANYPAFSYVTGTGGIQVPVSNAEILNIEILEPGAGYKHGDVIIIRGDLTIEYDFASTDQSEIPWREFITRDPDDLKYNRYGDTALKVGESNGPGYDDGNTNDTNSNQTFKGEIRILVDHTTLPYLNGNIVGIFNKRDKGSGIRDLMQGSGIEGNFGNGFPSANSHGNDYPDTWFGVHSADDYKNHFETPWLALDIYTVQGNAKNAGTNYYYRKNSGVAVGTPTGANSSNTFAAVFPTTTTGDDQPKHPWKANGGAWDAGKNLERSYDIGLQISGPDDTNAMGHELLHNLGITAGLVTETEPLLNGDTSYPIYYNFFSPEELTDLGNNITKQNVFRTISKNMDTQSYLNQWSEPTGIDDVYDDTNGSNPNFFERANHFLYGKYTYNFRGAIKEGTFLVSDEGDTTTHKGRGAVFAITFASFQNAGGAGDKATYIKSIVVKSPGYGYVVGDTVTFQGDRFILAVDDPSYSNPPSKASTTTNPSTGEITETPGRWDTQDTQGENTIVRGKGNGGDDVTIVIGALTLPWVNLTATNNTIVDSNDSNYVAADSNDQTTFALTPMQGAKGAQDVLSGLLDQVPERFALDSYATYKPIDQYYDNADAAYDYENGTALYVAADDVDSSDTSQTNYVAADVGGYYAEDSTVGLVQGSYVNGIATTSVNYNSALASTYQGQLDNATISGSYIGCIQNNIFNARGSSDNEQATVSLSGGTTAEVPFARQNYFSQARTAQEQYKAATFDIQFQPSSLDATKGQIKSITVNTYGSGYIAGDIIKIIGPLQPESVGTFEGEIEIEVKSWMLDYLNGPFTQYSPSWLYSGGNAANNYRGAWKYSGLTFEFEAPGLLKADNIPIDGAQAHGNGSADNMSGADGDQANSFMHDGLTQAYGSNEGPQPIVNCKVGVKVVNGEVASIKIKEYGQGWTASTQETSWTAWYLHVQGQHIRAPAGAGSDVPNNDDTNALNTYDSNDTTPGHLTDPTKAAGYNVVPIGEKAIDDIYVRLSADDYAYINGANKQPMPIIGGDKLQMVYTIMSHHDQEDATGDKIQIQRRCLVELVAVEQSKIYNGYNLNSLMPDSSEQKLSTTNTVSGEASAPGYIQDRYTGAASNVGNTDGLFQNRSAQNPFFGTLSALESGFGPPLVVLPGEGGLSSNSQAWYDEDQSGRNEGDGYIGYDANANNATIFTNAPPLVLPGSDTNDSNINVGGPDDAYSYLYDGSVIDTSTGGSTRPSGY